MAATSGGGGGERYGEASLVDDDDPQTRELDPHFVDAAAWACNVLTACLITGILAVVIGRMRRLVYVPAKGRACPLRSRSVTFCRTWSSTWQPESRRW